MPAMGPGHVPTSIDERIAAAIPGPMLAVIGRLRGQRHAVFVVGGWLRDWALGLPPASGNPPDLATSARPEELLELFPDASYENAFGTVVVPLDGLFHEITTFRSDHDYADFRRPHHVVFTDRVEDDLARRDFTVNSMAWGWAGGASEPRLVDPFGGLEDINLRRLKAVGDPEARFHEDALRMLRAVRLAATRDLTVDRDTLAAIRRNAHLAAHLSGERVAAELLRLLAADRPSIGLRLAEETGLLAVILPELAAQRGIGQNKVPGQDLWDHTLRTVDAAPLDRPMVRLAALLHDVGKPATLEDGRFPDHDRVGAEMAAQILRRLKLPRPTIERVAHLVRHHMFFLELPATDAAVRRFVIRIGEEALDDLFALRAADNVGSGLPAGDSRIDALRHRIDEQLAAAVALGLDDLAVDGRDVMAELGIGPGPRVGQVLDTLLELVIVDPALNERATLLQLMRSLPEAEAE